MSKTYIKSMRYKQGKFGGKLSININNLINELNPLKNEKGYVNLNIHELREIDKYGNTHYIVLDEWKPEPKKETEKEMPF